MGDKSYAVFSAETEQTLAYVLDIFSYENVFFSCIPGVCAGNCDGQMSKGP